MKTIFDLTTRQHLIERVETLSNNSNKEWGKMSIYQMIEHCVLSEEMYLGKTKYKRLFIGKLFGKGELKKMTKNTHDLKKNQPTHPTFKTTGNGDITPLKNKWIDLLTEYGNDAIDFEHFEHPFFGKMSKEQIGISVYKHTDHHLRQFNV